MRKKKRKKGLRLCSIAVLALAGVLSAGTPFLAIAEEQKGSPAVTIGRSIGPGAEEKAAEYLGEEDTAKLYDNVLEYSELQAMIRNFNPSVQDVLSGYNQTLEAYANAWDELKFGQAGARTDKEEAKDSGNAEEYASYKVEETTYRQAASSYKRMYDNLQNASSTSSQRQTERQQTVAAQSLMISYESLRHQKDALEKTRELYEKQYELTLVKQQAGMAARADVLDAGEKVLSAESSLASVEEGMESIYDSLCYMVGRGMDGSLTIAEIPEADCSRIQSMALDTDTVKAIGNNYTLISERHTSAESATSGAQNKLRKVENSEEKLTIKMKSLYEDVFQKKNELDAAETSWQRAQQEKQNADLKYSIGMLSQEEHIEAEMSYVQAQASYKAADLALTQAIDTYGWAVLGIADME